MKTHKDLDAWKESIDLVKFVYQETGSFPKEDHFLLVNQIRRSAVSIASNITEVAGRNSKKEFSQYLYFVLGSVSELETQLIISENLNYIKNNELFIEIEVERKLILGLIRYLKQKSL